jgi:nucleotide-binding universal stress UspA family protein
MHGMSKPTVLVGVSGSKASVGALRWAADESRRRGARLVTVRCWEPGQSAYHAAHGPIADDAHLQQAATQELTSTLHEVFGETLPASLYTEVIEGMAEQVLADRSAGADLLVLGSTSSPCVSGRSIGPIIHSCLSRAHCTVVVVGPEDVAASAATAVGDAAEENGQTFGPVGCSPRER